VFHVFVLLKGVDSDWLKSFIIKPGCFKRANWFPRNNPTMKLENIKVVARLKESPAAFFKVNKLILSEDEKSINISSLNGTEVVRIIL